jgi:hypothetical protein
MQIEIVETPICFHLHGLSSPVENHQYGQAGLKLMDEMWRAVKSTHTGNTGINHWVYLSDNRMFVGVQLLPDATAPQPLQPLAFELPRYLKHLHIGPYHALPAKWQSLKAELTARGETISWPSLEVYGHHCDDPAKQETTILLGLESKHAG